MQDSEAASLIGHTLGEYLLCGVLGIGGMAEVYRAMDQALEREVAVKVLAAAFAADADSVRRFREEAKQVAALLHPHIVPIYAFGEERGCFYHVMPLLHHSLRDRLLNDGRLPPDEAVRLVRQVASALEAAHALGLVHRDVKPGNILLDGDGDAFLADFGIAREVAALRQAGAPRTLSRTGMPVGTPEYMAPEQLRAEPCDQRADIYSLGAVLYELLTGGVPHTAASPFEVAALALSAPIQPPSQRNPQVWPALEQVVLKAVAFDPADRYPDMQSFAAALELALHRTDALWSATTLPPVDSVSTGAGARTGGRHAGRRPLALPLPLALSLPARLQQPRTLVAAALVLVLVVTALGMGIGMGTTGFLRLQAADTSGPVASGGGNGSGSGLPAAVPTVSTGPATVTTGTTGAPVTGTPTVTTPGPSPSSTTPVPTTTTTPDPTATPLLTPTIVVSASPLTFQPYPAPPTKPTNCVAVQTLTNTSAVDAQWSWHNAAGGWQYNTAGFNSTNWPGFPSVLTMTTPANSSVYIYIRTGYDTNCTSHSTVATITVTGGNGTGFNVSY